MGQKVFLLVIITAGALAVTMVCSRLVGALGTLAFPAGPHNGWRENSLPGAEDADRFLPHWDDFVYLSSKSGRFYAYPLNPTLDGNWREVPSTWVGEMGGTGHSDCDEIAQPWTPAIYTTASVVQGLECGYWTTGGDFLKYSFAVLDNGEIWLWRYRNR